MFWRKKNINGGNAYKDYSASGATVTDYLTDGLLVFDKNGKISLVNSWAEKLFSVGKEKILGKPILALSRYPNFQPLISLLGGGIKELFREELRVRENLILDVTTVPMMVEGKEVGNLVVLHDVTLE